MVEYSRIFAMPNSETFKIKPIGEFVNKYTQGAEVIVDPFARDSQIGTITNDLNPKTSAQHHMEAREFLTMLVDQRCQADVVLYDPPYSPTQIAECYNASGLTAQMVDTQNATLKSRCMGFIDSILKPGGVLLSFGWNSMGMGIKYPHLEVMMVYHGGAHNDTICVAQKKNVSDVRLI